MAKQRMVSTRFWSDSFIVNLDIIERYVFLYLLTNEHTNMCGIYEIPLRVMARETGIDEKELERLLENRFQEKVFYVDGWIYVKNFAKHQSPNANMQKGAKRELEEVPENIIANINKKIEWFERVRKGSKGFESSSHLTITIPNVTEQNVIGTEHKETKNFSDIFGEETSPTQSLKNCVSEASKPNGEIITVPPAKTKGPKILATMTDLEKSQVPQVIELFVKELGNSAVKYGDIWQREACLLLIRQNGFNATVNAARYAFMIRGKEFAPSITTPVELWNKLTKLGEYKARSAPVQERINAGLASEEDVLQKELEDMVLKSIKK